MTFLVAAVLAILTPASGGAQTAAGQTVIDPADRAVLAEMAAAMQGQPPDIGRLDAVLAKLPRPTRVRGMVQTARATVLAQEKDMGPAVAAIEESLRLLPDDPRPKLIATEIYTFSGAPERAADLWMQASRESPDFARMSDRYVMMALVGRLTDADDRARADRLSARMGEIGFASGLAPERSNAALARVRQAVREGRTQDAIADVTAVTDPTDLLQLYVDRGYAPLWPRIAEWAGEDLSAQSRRYLEELRSEWTAGDSFDTATPYARRLSAMDAHAAVVGLFLSMFDRVIPHAGRREQHQAGQEGMESLVPSVSRSLANLGRQAEARALLSRIATAMPVDDQGAALNVDGAFLTLAALDMDWEQVASRADTFLAKAKSFGPGINRSAVLTVLGWRACALSRLGREADAQVAIGEVMLAETVAPSTVVSLHLCRGDSAAARALVTARLADERTRSWALGFVQPGTEDAGTPYGKEVKQRANAVRTAPDVVAAALKVGRILPKATYKKLPVGFEPLSAPPIRTPLGPDAI